MVTPKGDKTESTLIASGAPMQRAVTSTDSGGKNGRIALEIQGKSLQVQTYKTAKGNLRKLSLDQNLRITTCLEAILLQLEKLRSV